MSDNESVEKTNNVVKSFTTQIARFKLHMLLISAIILACMLGVTWVVSVNMRNIEKCRASQKDFDHKIDEILCVMKNRTQLMKDLQVKIGQRLNDVMDIVSTPGLMPRPDEEEETTCKN